MDDLLHRWYDLVTETTADIVAAQEFLVDIRRSYYVPRWQIWRYRMSRSLYQSYRASTLTSLNVFRLIRNDSMRRLKNF